MGYYGNSQPSLSACGCWSCILLTCFLLHSCVILQTIDFKCFLPALSACGKCSLMYFSVSPHRLWRGRRRTTNMRWSVLRGRRSPCSRDWPSSRTSWVSGWTWLRSTVFFDRLFSQMMTRPLPPLPQVSPAEDLVCAKSANWQNAFWQSLKTPWNNLIHFCPEMFSLNLVQALIALF